MSTTQLNNHFRLTKFSTDFSEVKMVDNEKMSAQVKTALAEMVLPETLDDIEEYLRPEFPPRYHVRKAKEDEDEDEINGRRIVMDGFGRWREIRPKKYMEKKKLNLDIDPRELPQMKELFRINSSAMDGQGRRMIDNQSYTIPGLRSRYSDQYQPSCQSSRQRRSSQLKHRNLSDDDFMYDSLGKTTRSNVFPGVGKLQWNTTTARTFTKQPITAVNERKHFFGIQSDDFGAWSAANVLNERMKKAWEEYLASAPKATGRVYLVTCIDS